MTKRRKGKPHLNALLLAERVFVDQETGNNVIAGTFNTIRVAELPAFHVGSTLYLNLSDFSGKHRVRVRLVRLADGAELATSSDIAVEQEDRLSHMELKIKLPPLQFPERGLYALEVLWNGEYLGRCRVNVVERTT